MTLVTIKDLSAYLTIKESTLYSWVHNGTIPFHKLNGLIRFNMEEIEAWVQAAKQVSTDTGAPMKKTTYQDIDKIVKKSIDSAKSNRYNLTNGKPGQHQGLRKEE
jgi:excisionase family DNA binding protein